MAGRERGNWKKLAEKAGEIFPLRRFHPAVREWISADCGKRPVGVAVSGGSDSVLLLLLLWEHLPEWRKRLKVLHFDHRLRGEESDGDREFVVGLAGGLGLPVVAGIWERESGERVTEESARIARIGFFHEQLSAVGGEPAAVFFGHQRNDVVENVLMRLSRGSGSSGLAGPRPVQCFRDGKVHLRPLLDFSEKEIREGLERLGIPFRVDATNLRPGFYRNRLRRDVIPVWEEGAPFDVGKGVGLAREILEEEDAALEEWLGELLPGIGELEELDFGLLEGRPRALYRRALQAWLRGRGLIGSLTRRAAGELLESVWRREERVVSAGRESWLELSAEQVLRRRGRLVSAGADFGDRWPLPMNGVIFLPENRELEARRVRLEPELRERVLGGKVDEWRNAFILDGGELSVRNRRSGDRFQPLGAPGEKSLKDLLVDRKIPWVERDRLPVVFMDGRPVWIPGFPPSDLVRINDCTKMVVRLTYKGGGSV